MSFCCKIEASILKFIRYCSFVCAIAVFLLGFCYDSFNTLLIGVLLLLLSNVLYAFEDIKSRIFFLFFHGVIFVFLISRPCISMLRGDKWWYFNSDAVYFAVVALFTTMLFLLLGAVFASATFLNKPATKMQKRQQISQERHERFILSLRFVSAVLFYTAMFCLLAVEFEKLLFMRGRQYEEFYTLFRSRLPYALTVIADMTKYFLCIFLATMPSKRAAFLPLALYLFSAVPSLLIGMRNPIVLNFIFVILYYLIRDILGDRRKWLGFFEKLALVAFAPVAIVFLGAYNYIRAGTTAQSKGAIALIVDFLYKQGVSFDVLCIGYNSIPKIAYTGFTNYTFGAFIDYFTHGTIAQVIFSARSLGTGNNIVAALYSNSFAHRMSYVSRGDEYLQGHGWGSSYLLETYADFGFWGIAIFSFVLGIFLVCLMGMLKKNWFCFTFVLLILTKLFFLPRDSATGWLLFILTTQFWLALGFCYIASSLLVKDYSYRGALISKAGSTRTPWPIEKVPHLGCTAWPRGKME